MSENVMLVYSIPVTSFHQPSVQGMAHDCKVLWFLV